MYCFLRDLTKVFILMFFRLSISGKENIVDSGSVIYAANHTSMLDPFMLGFSIDREIRFLGKVELKKNFIIGKFIERIKVIPVDRSKNDIVAMKTCIKVLKEGGALGIFPEGTRVKDVATSENKAGVGLIAVKSGAVIQPITINATYKLFSKVNVIIHPIYVPEEREKYTNKDYEQISNDIMKIIRSDNDYKIS